MRNLKCTHLLFVKKNYQQHYLVETLARCITNFHLLENKSRKKIRKKTVGRIATIFLVFEHSDNATKKKYRGITRCKQNVPQSRSFH